MVIYIYIYMGSVSAIPEKYIIEVVAVKETVQYQIWNQIEEGQNRMEYTSYGGRILSGGYDLEYILVF